MDKILISVEKGQNPYRVIGEYIETNLECVEDIIAVIRVDDNTYNELYLVESPYEDDFDNDSYFVWQNDWYEGEENIALLDFFPVSEAISPHS